MRRGQNVFPKISVADLDRSVAPGPRRSIGANQGSLRSASRRVSVIPSQAFSPLYHFATFLNVQNLLFYASCSKSCYNVWCWGVELLADLSNVFLKYDIVQPLLDSRDMIDSIDLKGGIVSNINHFPSCRTIPSSTCIELQPISSSNQHDQANIILRSSLQGPARGERHAPYYLSQKCSVSTNCEKGPQDPLFEPSRRP